MIRVDRLLYFDVRSSKGQRFRSNIPTRAQEELFVYAKPILDGKINQDLTVCLIVSGLMRHGYAIFDPSAELDDAILELTEFIRSQKETKITDNWEIDPEFLDMFYPFGDHSSIQFGDHPNVLKFRYPFSCEPISVREMNLDQKTGKSMLGILGDDEEIIKSFISENNTTGIGVITLSVPLQIPHSGNGYRLRNRNASSNVSSPLIFRYLIDDGIPRGDIFDDICKTEKIKCIRGDIRVEPHTKLNFGESIMTHLKVATLRVKFFPNYKMGTTELGVIAIGDKILVREFPGIPFPEFIGIDLANSPLGSLALYKNEKELLLAFLLELSKLDPDIILGHKLCDTDLKIISERLRKLGIDTKTHGCTARRATRLITLTSTNYDVNYFTFGRLCCDIYDFSQKNLPTLKWNTLSEVFANIYKRTPVSKDFDLDADLINGEYFGLLPYFCNGELGFLRLCEWMALESSMLKEIEQTLSIVKLAEKISQHSYCPLREALAENRTTIGEFIFLRKFRENLILPPPVLRGNTRKHQSDRTAISKTSSAPVSLTAKNVSKLSTSRLVGTKRHVKEPSTPKSTLLQSKSMSNIPSALTNGNSDSLTQHDNTENQHPHTQDPKNNPNNDDFKANNLYKGGMILNVVPGIYTGKLTLLDVESLYPNIAILLKLCFTASPSFGNDPMHMSQISYCADSDGSKIVCYTDHPKAFLYDIFSEFIRLRKEVKLKIASPGDSYSIEEKALKITVNAMYGILGRPTFRFSRVDIAALITAHGRALLGRGIDIVMGSPQNIRLLYGHTDSLLTFTPREDVPLVGTTIDDVVLPKINGFHPCIRMKVDGSYSQCIILAKNSYIARCSKTGEVTFKGTEAQSRSSFQLLFECMRQTVKLIFTFYDDGSVLSKGLLSLAKEIALEINHIIETLPRRHIWELIMTMKLGNLKTDGNSNKNDVSKNNLPHHVRVAQSLRSLGMKIETGDMVHYISCISKTGSPTYCHPIVLVRESGSFAINYPYYVTKIKQFIVKLCASVDKNLGPLVSSLINKTS